MLFNLGPTWIYPGNPFVLSMNYQDVARFLCYSVLVDQKACFADVFFTDKDCGRWTVMADMRPPFVSCPAVDHN